jgi:5,10-methylenetetrahydrofolate reductase
VEWGRQVASVHPLLQATHFLLPDLPEVINASLRIEFYNVTSPQNRIVTIQASRYNTDSLERFIRENEANVNKFLIVGGNSKNSTSLSTVEAIKTARQFTEKDVWATANPNDGKSIESVSQKLEAGATGIITQPLLSHSAIGILNAYPRQGGRVGLGAVVYIAGVALPKTHESLLFWKNLLEQPELLSDSLFQQHLQYFMHPRDSLGWAQQELKRLLEGANIDGVHFMPMSNTAVLISLMTKPQ